MQTQLLWFTERTKPAALNKSAQLNKQQQKQGHKGSKKKSKAKCKRDYAKTLWDMLFGIENTLDENGEPTSHGGKKFLAKFGYIPLVADGNVRAITRNYNRIYGSAGVWQMTIIDDKKQYFYKIDQWIHYLKKIIWLSNIIYDQMQQCAGIDHKLVNQQQ